MIWTHLELETNQVFREPEPQTAEHALEGVIGITNATSTLATSTDTLKGEGARTWQKCLGDQDNASTLEWSSAL